MSQGWYVLEATIGEGGAVVTLGRRPPAQHATEPVVVVVLNEAGQSGLSVGHAGEALSVQDLSLEHRPKSLDLAVGPRRADLGAQVLDVQLAQEFAKAGQDEGHADHGGLAVSTHELQRLAAELKAFLQPGQDGNRGG